MYIKIFFYSIHTINFKAIFATTYIYLKVFITLYLSKLLFSLLNIIDYKYMYV